MNIKDVLTVRQPIAYFSYSWELCVQNKFKTFLLYGCETANDYKNNSVGNSRSKEASITDSWKLKVHVFCSHGENAKKSQIHVLRNFLSIERPWFAFSVVE